MCWFLILSVDKKRKQALWWQKIVTFAPPPKLFCLYNHTPLFFCFQLCFTQILAGVSRKSEIADPFYWAADAAFFSFSLATKKETKMAARFYVNNFTIRFFFSHPLFTWPRKRTKDEKVLQHFGRIDWWNDGIEQPRDRPTYRRNK